MRQGHKRPLPWTLPLPRISYTESSGRLVYAKKKANFWDILTVTDAATGARAECILDRPTEKVTWPYSLSGEIVGGNPPNL
jgi:hypothetical protein